jgi:hypothetical protein
MYLWWSYQVFGYLHIQLNDSRQNDMKKNEKKDSKVDGLI